MKKLIVILLSISLFSCYSPPDNRQKTKLPNASIYIEVVRGCEYIIFSGPNKGGIIHAADCHNNIHKNISVNGVVMDDHGIMQPYSGDTLIIGTGSNITIERNE